MFKRYLCVLFLLVVISSVNAYGTENEGATVTRGEAVKQMVSALYPRNFDLERYYCAHSSGYVHFVPDGELIESGYPILCELYMSVEGSGFKDITLESKYVIYTTLAKEMGIIHGYGDNTFRPENPITFNEAVKMLVCAFGYIWQVDEMGGYPRGYTKTAAEEGVITEQGLDGDEFINDQWLAQIISKYTEKPNGKTAVLVTWFNTPKTPEECVEKYAEAVKQRNGAMQFALLRGEFKEEQRGNYTDVGPWVTGFSSPWVSGYEYKKTDDTHYDIVFHYETSTGPEPDMVVVLTIEKFETDGNFYAGIIDINKS